MPLRRSNRLQAEVPQGRDYLGDLLHCSRITLEELITSHTFRPHLQLWYHLCVASERRFNDAVDWINTGAKGYYYNENDLEEDLLLMCLGEGEPSHDESEFGGYADECARTGKWITQEIWARTAWRIVHARPTSPENSCTVFEKMTAERPKAWAYGFVIELLCIAFHSLAFRSKASCWEGLINGYGKSRKANVSGFEDDEILANEDTSSSVSAGTSTTDLTLGSSTETSDHSSDADFATKALVHPAVKILAKHAVRKSDMVQEWINGVLATGFRGERIWLDPGDEIIELEAA